MIILRFYFWTLVYHLVTFYKQHPLAFLTGLVVWPYYIITGFIHPPDVHNELVINGTTGLKKCWTIEGAVLPPTFIERRFQVLEQDATQDS